MVMASQPGRVAMWPASQPTEPDLSWGFQPHLSSGTRSRVVRVFFISWSNSGSIDCPMVIRPPRRRRFESSTPEYRRTKGELQYAFFFSPSAFDAPPEGFVARKVGTGQRASWAVLADRPKRMEFLAR